MYEDTRLQLNTENRIIHMKILRTRDKEGKHIPQKSLDWRQAEQTTAKNFKDTEMLVINP